MPPLSQSVRAYSRRWSKYCMFSRSSGLISASMNASISARTPGRCSGRVKSTLISILSTSNSLEPVQGLLPNPRERGDCVVVADPHPQGRRADEDGGEVLEEQCDGRRGVLGIELAAVAL